MKLQLLYVYSLQFIKISDRTGEIREGRGDRRAERKGEQRGYLWV